MRLLWRRQRRQQTSALPVGMRSLYVFVLFVYATSFLFLHIFYVLCRAVSLDHVFLIRQFIAFHRLHLSFHRARSSSFRPLVGLYPVLLCLIAIVTTQLITGVSLPVTYVSGHKMSPVLTDGDFIFVESVNPVHVKVNDLILFHRHIEERVTDDNNHVDVNNHVPKTIVTISRTLTRSRVLSIRRIGRPA